MIVLFIVISLEDYLRGDHIVQFYNFSLRTKKRMLYSLLITDQEINCAVFFLCNFTFIILEKQICLYLKTSTRTRHSSCC